MFDPRRSRYVVAALLALAAAVTALNVGLSALAGPSSRWFPADEDTYDWYFLEMAAGRFSGARHQAGHFGALVGLSTTACAIDGGILAQEGPAGYRWITANSYGGSPHKIAIFSRLLAAFRLRPDVIVLGINPIMLCEATVHRDPPPEEAPAPAAGRPSARELLRRAVDHIWAIESRYEAKHMLRVAALGFKMRLLARLGADPAAATAPSAEPFEAVEVEETGDLARENFDKAVKDYRLRGYFKPEAYPSESPQADELVEAVAAARSTGARVVVVLLPEATPIRENLPPVAVRLPGEVLARAFGADAPPILDFRAALPDDAFNHPTHASRRGKEIFTPMVGQRLRELLK